MIDAGLIDATADEATVEAKIKQASTLVEALTGRIFESRSFVDYVNGGYDFYGFNNPILGVTKVSQVQADLGGSLELYSFDNYYIIDKRFPLHSDDVFGLQFSDSLPKGHNNIKFELTVGFLENGETPSLIQHLTGKLTTFYLDPDLASGLARGILSERADDHSISYNRDYESLTGDDQLDDIIKMYRSSRVELIGGLA